MFNNTTTKRLLAVFAVLAVLMAGTFGAMAAAPSLDTETTETAHETDITDGGSHVYNGTGTANLSWSADSNNSKVLLEQNGRTVYSATPDEYYHNASSGMSYFNVSLADDGSDYSTLEAGAGENVTLNVTFENDTTLSSPDTSTANYTFANGNEMAWVYQTSAEADDEDTTSFASYGFGASFASLDTLTGDSDLVDPVMVEQTTDVNQNTSEVVVTFSDSDTQDAFEEAQTDASSGEWLPMASVEMDDETVPVFSEEADVSWVDTDEDTYAVVSSDGSTVTVHNAGELVEDTEAVDIVATGNKNIGYSNAKSMLEGYDVSGFDLYNLAFDAWSPPVGGASFEA
ncbi:hypothetical protein C2R22_24505 (plasmid) [Salinigranum rubrum]|uniref:Uncharacterized protein n=1 Tax=Salinigranum rubrum TaxID=755307 RepID=A0A2I8VS08_9EURY|nr:hypothetical protein [Salinigranum rubrum]AUV84693.1 hypothetical protein C2R22_24505 [Salinigranum rubrum]